MQTASECPNIPEIPEETVHSGSYGHQVEIRNSGDQPIVSFAVYLRRIRKARGFTQDQLSETADVAVRTIARWESGETADPDMTQLHRVLDVLDVRPDFAFRLVGWLPDVDPLYERLHRLQEQVRAMADELRDIQALLDYGDAGPDEDETSDENTE